MLGNIVEFSKKKSGIGRCKVSMCIKSVAAISTLKLGITKEDTLCGFG